MKDNEMQEIKDITFELMKARTKFINGLLR